MTCIIAVEHDGKVYMGGDSLELCGLDIERAPKVFVSGEFIVGSTGSVRFGQLIEFNLFYPERTDGDSDMGYIVQRLIPAIRQCAKDHGYTKIESNVEKLKDILLIGYRGKIYKIHSDFSVQHPSRLFCAVGCGEDFALGAMFTLTSHKSVADVERNILSALKTAGEFCAGVSGPYYVLSGGGVK